MKPHMDRFTSKSSIVMSARKAKLLACRDINAANKRRQIILEQLACNGKLWLDQCTVNMNVNKLIHFHCPMSQEKLGPSKSEGLLNSLLLGCRVAGSDASDQRDAEDSQVVGEVDRVAMALHDTHLKTIHLQLQHDDLGHQKIIAVRGCAPETAKEEPFCQLKEMAMISESVQSVSRSKPSTKSQYAKSDAARLHFYNDCDSLCCILSDNSHKVCAARTPPANANKYKKRLGAKQSSQRILKT